MKSVSMKELSSQVTTMEEPTEPKQEKTDELKESIFTTLNAINVTEHVEKKNGLSYLSWSWAWSELQKRYPDASYTIERFDNKPYLYDDNTGYMVFTTVTVNGVTREMWLPVMDSNNKAMKNTEYEYVVMVWNEAQHRKVPVKRIVRTATMFDINKAIMRCLVKNIGMFGLGLYIYSGEDLPEQAQEEMEQTELEKKKKADEEAQNKALTQWTKQWQELRQELTDMGVDYRSEKTVVWLDKHFKIKSQDACNDVQSMINLCNAYKEIIRINKKMSANG